MKKTTLVFALLCIINFGFSQEIAKVKSVIIKSKALNQTREILIYTPQSYDEAIHTYYDVIYVFDSHIRELFDYTHSLISFLSNGNRKFIVVGITSPYNEKLDYSRKTDFLPELTTAESRKRYGKYSGNADNFFMYVKNEVFTYIDSNYRTLNNRTAVGHSLSASFVIYSMLKNYKIFDNYIAISPNLEYDNQRLVNELKKFEYNNLKDNSFLFFSSADESNYWKEWGPAFENAYNFLKDSIENKKITVLVKDFKEFSHWNSFATAFKFAFEKYLSSAYENQKKMLSVDSYEITIKVRVPKKDDEIYIVGNQEALGNWQPSVIKMKRLSDNYREIKLKVHSPAQFKFTKGYWDSEAIVENVFTEIIINPKGKKKYNFKIESYSND